MALDAMQQQQTAQTITLLGKPAGLELKTVVCGVSDCFE
jgi:hypothetical protein